MEIESKKRLILLVLCSRNYLSFISSRTQKKTWSKNSTNLKIIHFIGASKKNNREIEYIKDSTHEYLVLETDDSYANLAKKTLMAIEEVYKRYEFDYIFRTNTSSYIDLDAINNYFENYKDELSYAGVHVNTVEGDLIASGAGIFLSKKNIKLLLENKSNINYDLPDDVAIAKFLASHKIYPKNIERKDLKHIPTPKDLKNEKYFHYRCRLDPQYHRILEPGLIRYLDRCKNGSFIVSIINFIYLKALFYITNFYLVKKVLQKYYSYKFYGEIYFQKKLIYKTKS